MTNGIDYLAIDTRLSYIDAYSVQSPTYTYYDVAKFVNPSSFGPGSLHDWNWSAPTSGSSFYVGASQVTLAANATSNTWYALEAHPLAVPPSGYVYVSGSIPQIQLGAQAPVVIIYYDSSGTNFTEVRLDQAASFSALVPTRYPPYEVRFALYAQTSQQGLSITINALKSYASPSEIDFTPLHLKYSSQHIFIFEFGNTTVPPTVQPSVYPLYLYLPVQVTGILLVGIFENIEWKKGKLNLCSISRSPSMVTRQMK